jgi:uncharacterized membrane protein
MRDVKPVEETALRQATADESSAHPAQRHSLREGHAQTGFDMEVLVGYILLVGVLTSMALILAGLIWHWLKTGQLGISYDIAGMTFFEFLWKDLQLLFTDQVRPRLLVSLGIAALMLTPFVRVLASMVYFALAARNWKYTVFTAFVLSVLTYSLFLR